MTLYAYVKAPSGYTIKKQKTYKSTVKAIFSLVLILIGVTSLTTVLYPLISYQISYAPGFSKIN